MQLSFYKFQGTGNHFIMIDNRNKTIPLSTQQIEKLCNVNFGIGADGLILIEPAEGYDFKMVYYNSDGKESSMCGNGGRCIVAFAHMLGIIKDKATFLAIDGPHEALVNQANTNQWQVNLKMIDVETVENIENDYWLNTGSPHYVKQVTDLAHYDVYTQGKAIRNTESYKAQGTNVNFIEPTPNGIFVRTYERGVENETYSCGTGVTAAAIVAFKAGLVNAPTVAIKTLGGNLEVAFTPSTHGYQNIWLNGPAVLVYNGLLTI